MKYLYALLALVPVTIALEYLTHADVLIFISSALALIPLAAVLGKATEELAVHTGPRIGGLLNATLGNAAELIITIVALNAGLVELVKASITGSILGNILVVLGFSLLVGGIKNGLQRFDRAEASVVSTMLIIAVLALVVPTIFSRSIEAESGHASVQYLSDGVAIVMLVLYAAYLTYTFFYSPHNGGDKQESSGPASGQEHEGSTWSLPVSIGVLVVTTVFVVFMSEILVGVVEPITKSLGWTEIFLGVMIIPIVGNVAEHIVGVQVAYKNQMDLSLGISLGSSLQVALFVAPVLVYTSLLLGHPMTLVFTTFEIVALLGAVLIGAFVSVDGESNWLEGIMLVAVYLILGVSFFFLPAS